MKIEVTKDVENHKINQDYPCLLVYFDPHEDPIEYDWDEIIVGERIDPTVNWMPSFSDLIKINRRMCELDPVFQRKLKELLRDVERDVPVVEAGE